MHRINVKNTTIALVMSFSISTGQTVNAADADKQTAATVIGKRNAQATQQRLLSDKRRTTEREAKQVIDDTHKALQALQEKEREKAMGLLQQVSGQLDILLAKHPDLELLPANVKAEVYDFDGDAQQVGESIDTVDDLLDDNKIQDAREILSTLVSEIRLSTVNIPLGVFPDAIEEAAALCDQGETEAAAGVLTNVLNLLVTTIDIYPLPVLRAENLLNQAAKLEHKSDLSKEESRQEVLKATEAARQQLKLASALGYGDREAYRQLYDTIAEIKDVLHSEKSAATWNKIKQSLSAIKNKIIHPKQ